VVYGDDESEDGDDAYDESVCAYYLLLQERQKLTNWLLEH
jgi:hypothetical protein